MFYNAGRSKRFRMSSTIWLLETTANTNPDPHAAQGPARCEELL